MSTGKSNSMKDLEIVDVQSFSTSVPVANSYVAYQIYFRLGVPITLTIGKLGSRDFPAGDYVYTGSARRNIRARVLRHLERVKSLHWHIDYLLSSPVVSISRIILSTSSFPNRVNFRSTLTFGSAVFIDVFQMASALFFAIRGTESRNNYPSFSAIVEFALARR